MKNDLPKRRVVITGMGAITSLGQQVGEIWEAVAAGRSGIRHIRQFDSTDFPVNIGSEVDLDEVSWEGLGEINLQISRSALFGIWAMEQAWQDAGLAPTLPQPERAGVCIGASTFPVVDETLKLANPRKLLEGELFTADNTAYYLEICRQRPDLLSQRNFSSISDGKALKPRATSSDPTGKPAPSQMTL